MRAEHTAISGHRLIRLGSTALDVFPLCSRGGVLLQYVRDIGQHLHDYLSIPRPSAC